MIDLRTEEEEERERKTKGRRKLSLSVCRLSTVPDVEGPINVCRRKRV